MLLIFTTTLGNVLSNLVKTTVCLVQTWFGNLEQFVGREVNLLVWKLQCSCADTVTCQHWIFSADDIFACTHLGSREGAEG